MSLDKKSKIYIAGTGKELTIRELSELVVKAVGFEGEVEFVMPASLMEPQESSSL